MNTQPIVPRPEPLPPPRQPDPLGLFVKLADEHGYREAIDALQRALESNRPLLTLAAAKATLALGDINEDDPWPDNPSLPGLASTPEKRAAQLHAELLRAALQAEQDDDDG